jgi:hypothetical protein
MRIAMLDVMLNPARPGFSGLSDMVWHIARELAGLGDQVAIIGVYSSKASFPPGDVQVHRLDPLPENGGTFRAPRIHHHALEFQSGKKGFGN